MDVDFETTVKLEIYRAIAETAKMPSAGQVADTLGRDLEEVLAAFSRLHAKRLIVPEPSDPARIRMAPPFSGVATAFLVKARGKGYFANCVWDAYGVAAALHADAVVAAADGWSGEAMTLEVRDGQPVRTMGVAHFAVPAARWWDDIVHT